MASSRDAPCTSRAGPAIAIQPSSLVATAVGFVADADAAGGVSLRTTGSLRSHAHSRKGRRVVPRETRERKNPGRRRGMPPNLVSCRRPSIRPETIMRTQAMGGLGTNDAFTLRAPWRERASWALYDFANTIFSMNVATLYFS